MRKVQWMGSLRYVRNAAVFCLTLSLMCILSSSCGNLVVPRTRRRIGDRAFSVASPRAWNRLPPGWNWCDRRTRFVVIWQHFYFILFMGTRIRIDSVMRPRSSRGRNTSALVTVTVIDLKQIGPEVNAHGLTQHNERAVLSYFGTYPPQPRQGCVLVTGV